MPSTSSVSSLTQRFAQARLTLADAQLGLADAALGHFRLARDAGIAR